MLLSEGDDAMLVVAQLLEQRSNFRQVCLAELGSWAAGQLGGWAEGANRKQGMRFADPAPLCLQSWTARQWHDRSERSQWHSDLGGVRF